MVAAFYYMIRAIATAMVPVGAGMALISLPWIGLGIAVTSAGAAWSANKAIHTLDQRELEALKEGLKQQSRRP